MILFFYTFISFLCGIVFVREAINIGLINVLFILLKTFSISLSWAFTMKAMSKLQLGIVVPFSLLGSVFTALLAYMFFGEKIEQIALKVLQNALMPGLGVETLSSS